MISAGTIVEPTARRRNLLNWRLQQAIIVRASGYQPGSGSA